MPSTRARYNLKTHQATTIYLPKALHEQTARHARQLSALEDGRVTQSEVIRRALTEYFERTSKEGERNG